MIEIDRLMELARAGKLRLVIPAVAVAIAFAFDVAMAIAGEPSDFLVVVVATTALLVVPAVGFLFATSLSPNGPKPGSSASLLRFRIRSMMIAVLVTALIASLLVVRARLAERSRYCLVRAEQHALMAQQYRAQAAASNMRADYLKISQSNASKHLTVGAKAQQHIDDAKKHEAKARAEEHLSRLYELAASNPLTPVPSEPK